MPDHRFFLSAPFHSGGLLFLQEQEFHHLQNVMRIKEGELVELINGQGQLAIAIVHKLEKHKAHLLLQEVITEQPIPSTLILAQAMPRMARLENIVEKATELGVTEIWLFPSVHSEKKEYSPSQLHRLQQILIASIKQCGRLFLPSLAYKPPLSQWKTLTTPCFFGDTDPDAPHFLQALQEQNSLSALWMVGPEQGLTIQESQLLKKDLAMTGVSINPYTLRVDTAAIVGLALLSLFNKK
ncbi:MAG: RsmE family RNA methyltransferase [Chlamydiia bacterium]